MIHSKRTFGDNLYHFVRSIDIVDANTKDQILNLIESYLSDELGIKYFTLYIESKVNDKVGLKTTEWVRGGEGNSFSIRDDEDCYQGHVSLAYDQAKSLWIVNPEKQGLAVADNYIDLWSKVESKDIPAYVRRTEFKILTSIIRPIKDEFRCFGAINFESIRYLEYSDSVRDELTLISKSITTLYSLNKNYTSQKNNTSQEIKYLSELRRNKGALVKVSKPRLFLASSDRADTKVMGVIREVIGDFSDKLDLVYWKEVSDSGIINQQILREITSCQFGICYFSEQEDNDETQYRDNKNVLIEAGMLSGNSMDTSFDNWIPIREKDSGNIPFDIMTARILFVPRNNGKLNTDLFKDELHSRLDAWEEIH